MAVAIALSVLVAGANIAGAALIAAPTNCAALAQGEQGAARQFSSRSDNQIRLTSVYTGEADGQATARTRRAASATESTVTTSADSAPVTADAADATLWILLGAAAVALIGVAAFLIFRGR